MKNKLQHKTKTKTRASQAAGTGPNEIEYSFKHIDLVGYIVDDFVFSIVPIKLFGIPRL